jgi:hypothetical protein
MFIPHSNLPGRILAAVQFLHYTLAITSGNDEGPIPGGNPRELTTQEARVKDAALQALLEYFNSDDHGAGPAGATAAPDPNAPVPVPNV